ncbi:MAG: Spy/CpxP family protein refolding chaperone [Prevotellaceae bacterium]|jgi:Spy/CpxP family protein refolding chaperone|nr:Spy/CpxP family protein refolding chaperone [Prevotellaceae bacterium]
MKNTVCTAIMMISLLVGMAGAAHAQTEQRIRTGHPFLLNDKVTPDMIKKFRQLRENNTMGISNLTDDQKAKIKAICLSEQKRSLQFCNQMGEKRARLRSLETAYKADIKEINKVIDEIVKFQADIMKLKADSKQKIRDLLTDEQRVEFDVKNGGEQHISMCMRCNNALSSVHAGSLAKFRSFFDSGESIT